MKLNAYILLLSMLMLVAFPMIRHLQVPVELTVTCCDACCCDSPEDTCTDENQDEEKDHACDSGCDCGCQFHLNAVQFQFNNMQVAEEQEYYYGKYHNEYSFEYLNLLIHPPRLA